MENGTGFFSRYKKALSIGASVVTAVTTIGGAGFYLANELVFKPDLIQSEQRLYKSIRQNTVEALKLRLSQEESNKRIYEGAVRTIEDVEDPSVTDLRNLETFKRSLTDTEFEIRQLEERIRILQSSLEGN